MSKKKNVFSIIEKYLKKGFQIEEISTQIITKELREKFNQEIERLCLYNYKNCYKKKYLTKKENFSFDAVEAEIDILYFLSVVSHDYSLSKREMKNILRNILKK